MKNDNTYDDLTVPIFVIVGNYPTTEVDYYSLLEMYLYAPSGVDSPPDGARFIADFDFNETNPQRIDVSFVLNAKSPSSVFRVIFFSHSKCTKSSKELVRTVNKR